MVPIRLESGQERRGSAGKELENYYIDITQLNNHVFQDYSYLSYIFMYDMFLVFYYTVKTGSLGGQKCILQSLAKYLKSLWQDIHNNLSIRPHILA